MKKAKAIATIHVQLELDDEQAMEFDEIKKRLLELNDAGRTGLCMAQVHFRDDRVIIRAGLIEDEKRAEAICLAAGQTKASIHETYKSVKKTARGVK